MIRIRQRISAPRIEDVTGAVSQEVSRLSLEAKLRPGDTVAVTAGSRGIPQIDLITRRVIEALHGLGANPFIVPAMGSHGGATAQGQVKVLAQYGISEASMGVSIRSSMNVVRMGTSPFGFPVYTDKHTSEAQHIVLINRIKPHTRFSGRIESGLVKMLLVGLGKHQGAQLYHRAVLEYPWEEIVNCVAPILLQRLPILFGLAILENARGEVVGLRALLPEEFLDKEPQLLERSFQLMAKLPFKEADLLIVDEMGKDISGTGMDTTIIGRKGDERVKIKRIFVRDLTDKSEGNACGIGLADFTTRRLVDKINLTDTYVNCIAALRPEGAKIPITYDTDREALEQALSTLGLVSPEETRAMWIKNTRDLETLRVSEAYGNELEARRDLEVLSPPEEIKLDPRGNLIP
ncbi:MAG: lactate racemase domain-containing protein [Candidatus Brocadiales bacterium]|nr:lactate racemase domain-containing protein [Candidatus Brocadiales bacterium]